jgi:hypothetical protein
VNIGGTWGLACALWGWPLEHFGIVKAPSGDGVSVYPWVVYGAEPLAVPQAKYSVEEYPSANHYESFICVHSRHVFVGNCRKSKGVGKKAARLIRISLYDAHGWDSLTGFPVWGIAKPIWPFGWSCVRSDNVEGGIHKYYRRLTYVDKRENGVGDVPVFSGSSGVPSCNPVEYKATSLGGYLSINASLGFSQAFIGKIYRHTDGYECKKTRNQITPSHESLNAQILSLEDEIHRSQIRWAVFGFFGVIVVGLMARMVVYFIIVRYSERTGKP